jgi:hypothetical protein
MKNHWINKNEDIDDFIRKEMDREIIADLRDELDKRHPYKFILSQHVQTEIEGILITGKINGCYRETTGDGWINHYNVKLDKSFYGFNEMDFSEVRLANCWYPNVIPQYYLGDEKKFEHNAQVKTTEDPKLTLNPDTFCPQKSMDIKLTIAMDAQHDGHGWDKEWIEKCYNRLIEEIMADIKSQIEPFVRDVNPFGIHYYP